MEMLLLEYEDRLQRHRTAIVSVDFDIEGWFERMKEDGWWKRKYKLRDVSVKRITVAT